MTLSVLAQKKARPNFSGVWILDLEKSRHPTFSTKKVLPVGDATHKTTTVLEIVHGEPKFSAKLTHVVEELDGSGKVVKTTESLVWKGVFNTDGSGETNPVSDHVSESSVTKWKDNTISIYRDDILPKVSFSLSKDGTELTMISLTGWVAGSIEAATPPFPLRNKDVFLKKS